MRKTIGADALQGEAEATELADDLRDCIAVGTDVCDDIDVLTGLNRQLAVLKRVQQDHLPADKRPLRGRAAGEVEQDVP